MCSHSYNRGLVEEARRLREEKGKAAVEGRRQKLCEPIGKEDGSPRSSGSL